MSARLLVFIAFALAASPAGAMILTSGDGRGNTTAPPDDFGFANVGQAGQTAVYLGAGWVISANHVALRQVGLQGIPYKALPRSKVRIRNESARVSADIAMYRLSDVPDLPSLPDWWPKLALFVFVTHMPFFAWRWRRTGELRHAATTATFTLLIASYAVAVFAPDARLANTRIHEPLRAVALASAAVSLALLAAHWLRNGLRRLRSRR